MPIPDNPIPAPIPEPGLTDHEREIIDEEQRRRSTRYTGRTRSLGTVRPGRGQLAADVADNTLRGMRPPATPAEWIINDNGEGEEVQAEAALSTNRKPKKLTNFGGPQYNRLRFASSLED